MNGPGIGGEDRQERRRAVGQTLLRGSLLLLIWLGLTAALWQRGSAAEWLAWTTLTGLIASGVLLPVAAMYGMSGSRELERELISCGDTAMVKLTVRTRLPMPVVWLSIREELVSENRRDPVIVRERKLVLPWLRREWRFSYSLAGLPRGIYHWRATMLVAGDLFGLYEQRRYFAMANRLSVAPVPSREIVTAGSLRLRAGGVTDVAQHSQQGLQPGAGVERRPYRTGDPLRHLDWHSAAKGREWLTRLVPSEELAPLRIIVDPQVEDSHAGQLLLDACAELALAAAEACQKGGVELIVNGRAIGKMGDGAGDMTGHAKIRQALAGIKAANPPSRVNHSSRVQMWPDDTSGRETGPLLIISGNGGLWAPLAAEARASGSLVEIWRVSLADRQPSAGGGEQHASNGTASPWVVSCDSWRPGMGEKGEWRDAGIS